VLAPLGLDTPDTLRYQDSERAQLRTLRLSTPNAQGQRALQGFALAGDTRSGAWLQDLLEQGQALDWPARQWLQASSTPPPGSAPASRQVCSCLNVREDTINACLSGLRGSEHERLARLQEKLHCGTRCGSCVPELKRLVRQLPLSA
jgi:assimilatory nitrate reductase catalytic subunit